MKEKTEKNTKKDIRKDIREALKKLIIKYRKELLILSAVFLVCIIAVFGINAYVKLAVADRIFTGAEPGQIENIDCIMVLGCGVNDDGTPSYMLRDRLKRASDIYKIRKDTLGETTKILVTGDHGTKGYDEVNCMKQWLMDSGVPSSDIFMDHAGFSTYDSMYRASEIFGCKKMLIISQEYHLYRAVYIAKSLGIDAYGCGPADFYVGSKYRSFREILARDKDWIKCIFKPKAELLGEKIDIHGNGDVTND